MLSIEHAFVRTERPLYSHLVSLLESAIARGELPSGARLPPERALAQRLRISRTTVVSAYRELEARGLLRGYVGRGTFVCAAPEPEGTPFAWRGKIAAAALRSSDSTLRDVVRNSSDARLLSLAAGEPAIDKFPNDAFLEATTHVLTNDPGAAWGHGPTEGQPVLRNAIADRYNVPRESVLILSGAQQGLDLLARCLIDPGDAVILDRPGYLGAIQSFRAAGAKLIGWDLGRGDSDELEDLLVRYRPKLIARTRRSTIRPVSHSRFARGVKSSRSRSDTGCRLSRTRPIAICISTSRRPRRSARSTTGTSSSS